MSEFTQHWMAEIYSTDRRVWKKKLIKYRFARFLLFPPLLSPPTPRLRTHTSHDGRRKSNNFTTSHLLLQPPTNQPLVLLSINSNILRRTKKKKKLHKQSQLLPSRTLAPACLPDKEESLSISLSTRFLRLLHETPIILPVTRVMWGWQRAKFQLFRKSIIFCRTSGANVPSRLSVLFAVPSEEQDVEAATTFQIKRKSFNYIWN